MLCHFEQGDAEGPHVRGDGVGLAGDALGRHVVGGADEGVCVAAGAEFARDAKVTEFDGAGAGEEDVGGFDVCSRGESMELAARMRWGGKEEGGKAWA